MLPAVRRQRIIPGEDPEGVMRPFVEEWEKVAAGLQRVRWEALGTGTGCDTELLKGLPEYPGVAELKPSLTPQSPVLPMVFRKGNQRFSYFSLITTVGTPSASLRKTCVWSACFRQKLRREHYDD